MSIIEGLLYLYISLLICYARVDKVGILVFEWWCKLAKTDEAFSHRHVGSAVLLAVYGFRGLGRANVT
jgi:hypothetical protein